MSEENVKEMIANEHCCFHDAKPMPLMDEEEIAGDDVLLLPPPPPPPAVVSNPRRNSTGGLDKRGPSKAQAQIRYRGNQMGSTHDLCKHGKRREDDLVIKPWKLVKKKNVEGGDLGKVESLNVNKKKEKSLQVAKREVANEIVKSPSGLRGKRIETKRSSSSSTNPSDSAVETKRDAAAASEVVKSPHGLRVKRSETKTSTASPSEIKKTNLDVKKVSRISENKEKIKKKIDEPKIDELKIDGTISCEDMKEKTLYVVESSIEEKKIKKSIKSVKSETQQSSEKKFLRSKRSPSLIPSLSPSSEEVKGSRVTRSDPRPIRQTTTTSRSKTGLSEKKEIGSANLVTNSKTESKIVRPKRIGLKVTPPTTLTRQVSFKKGKVLEPKPEDSTSTSIKFKKRVVQEPKLRSDVNKKKKNLKRDQGVGKMSIINGEGKREKVVLRHRKVEAKKKLQTLFNNVIEETVSKLEEVRKSKVKALVGAFETVISLQDDKTKTSQKKKKIQTKSTSSQVIEG